MSSALPRWCAVFVFGGLAMAVVIGRQQHAVSQQQQAALRAALFAAQPASKGLQRQSQTVGDDRTTSVPATAEDTGTAPAVAPNDRPWLYPIALPAGSGTDVEQAAERLAAALGLPSGVHKTDQNPVCCLWLEVGQWTPSTNEPGYVVILQLGGGRVIASDVDQLNRAIDHIVRVGKPKGPRVVLPDGVLTSYAVSP